MSTPHKGILEGKMGGKKRRSIRREKSKQICALVLVFMQYVMDIGTITHSLWYSIRDDV